MQATEKSPEALRKGVDVFTTGQVSRLMGVTKGVVLRWCNLGMLPSLQLPGSGHRRIMRADLQAFLHAEGLPRLPLEKTQTILVGVRDHIDGATPAISLLDLGLSLDRTMDRHIIAIDFATTGRGEGMAAARRLRSEFPASRLKLIALACEDECAALELGQAGFNTVLLSPVAPKVLREAIGAAMGEG